MMNHALLHGEHHTGVESIVGSTEEKILDMGRVECDGQLRTGKCKFWSVQSPTGLLLLLLLSTTLLS